MRYILLIILFISVGSFAADWELKKNEDGIIVYTREIANSDFLEYKGIATVNASRRKVAEVILRISDYINWFPDCLDSKRLSYPDKNEVLVYYKIDSPWPVKDRDAVVHLYINDEPDKNKTTIDFKAEPNSLEKYPGVVRVPKSSGYWKLESINNQTKVTYQNHADPGGSVPAWVVNMFVVDAPFKTLLAIKNKFI